MKVVELDKTYRGQILGLMNSVLFADATTNMSPTERQKYFSKREADVDHCLENGTYLGVFKKDHILGFCGFSTRGHISQLFIRSSDQNLGFGTKLLEHAINMCETEEVTVNASAEAVAFYQKNGFSLKGKSEALYGVEYFPMVKAR